jgi:hypothetical protein
MGFDTARFSGAAEGSGKNSTRRLTLPVHREERIRQQRLDVIRHDGSRHLADR